MGENLLKSGVIYMYIMPHNNQRKHHIFMEIEGLFMRWKESKVFLRSTMAEKKGGIL